MATEISLMPGIKEGLGGSGPYVLRLEEDGEVIREADVEIGYSHRGIEKCFEKVNYFVGNSFADKVDYLAAPACNLAYSLAIEELSGMEIPTSAQFIRILLLELNRINSHLFYLAHLANCVGSATAFYFGLREREKYADIFEMYCGSRVPFNAIKIGGVSDKLTEGLLYKIETTLQETKSFLKELDGLLISNPVFQHRLKNLAPLTKEVAINFGISGPNARSAGYEIDVRIQKPYSSYDSIALDPIKFDSSTGDAFARVLYRIKEIQQSSSIVEKVIKAIPSGNHCIPVSTDFYPPAGDAYVEVESPRGVLGVFVHSTGGTNPNRVKFVCPSFFCLRLAPFLLREEMLEDAEVIIQGLDISISEVDR